MERENAIKFTAQLIELEEKKIAKTRAMREKLWEEAIANGKKGASHPTGEQGK